VAFTAAARSSEVPAPAANGRGTIALVSPRASAIPDEPASVGSPEPEVRVSAVAGGAEGPSVAASGRSGGGSNGSASSSGRGTAASSSSVAAPAAAPTVDTRGDGTPEDNGVDDDDDGEDRSGHRDGDDDGAKSNFGPGNYEHPGRHGGDDD
jgi:hypothetical protein